MKKTVIAGITVIALAVVMLALCTLSASDGNAEESLNETTHASKIETADNNPQKAKIEQTSEESEKKIGIADCEITVRDRTYAGKFTEPAVRVKYNGERLVRDVDYTVEYDSTENRGAGKYYLTLTMKNGYEGSARKAYYVLPEGTAFTDIGTKVSSIELHWTECKENADGYEIAYSENGGMTEAQTIFVEDNTDTVYTVEKLPQNGTYYIRIRSYKNAGEEKIYSIWSTIKTVETKKVVVKDGVTYIDGIIIANKTYSLPEDYGSGLDDEALEAFYTMASDAADEGIYLNIVSGFRSYWLQDTIYSNFCAERGVEEADKVSARPGHSEHQTGLAMDINSTWFTFADTAEGKWLASNCYKYGFVIRYPEGKEDITGYSYEAWHIRYLGIELSRELYESGLTLEEYLSITSEYNE